MRKSESIDRTTKRKYVSKLFYYVLSGKITVKDALLKFPADCNDKSLTASWHALCHLDADEDLRKKDKEYSEEQDEYMEFIASTLQTGGELPQNIIKEYLPYYEEALIAENKTIKGIFNKLKKFLCC